MKALDDSELRTLEVLVEAEKRLTGGHVRYEVRSGDGVYIVAMVDTSGIEHRFEHPIFVAGMFP